MKLTTKEIVEKINSTKNANGESLSLIEDWFSIKVEELVEDIDSYLTDEEMKIDPSVFQQRLYRYHLLLGGLSGLGTTLYDRITSLSISSVVPEGSKMTALEKESKAKALAARTKGIKVLVESTINNLTMRSYGSRAKSW